MPRPVLTELIDAHHRSFSYRCCVCGALCRHVRRLVRPGADDANGRSGDDGRHSRASGRDEIRDGRERQLRHEREPAGCGCECGDADDTGGELSDGECDNASRGGHTAIVPHHHDGGTCRDGSALHAVLGGCCCNAAGRAFDRGRRADDSFAFGSGRYGGQACRVRYGDDRSRRIARAHDGRRARSIAVAGRCVCREDRGREDRRYDDTGCNGSGYALCSGDR